MEVIQGEMAGWQATGSPPPNPHPHEDTVLIQGVRGGDQQALEDLVRRFGGMAYRLGLRITGNPMDAEEVSQDGIWAAVQKIDTFKGEAALGSWIYRIVANAAYQKIRSRRGKEEVSWEDLLPRFGDDGRHIAPVEDWSKLAEDPAVEGEARRVLQRVIDRLPQDHRTAFVLHDIEGLSNPEISEALGISLPAVKSRVHRARLFLRKELSNYFDRS